MIFYLKFLLPLMTGILASCSKTKILEEIKFADYKIALELNDTEAQKKIIIKKSGAVAYKAEEIGTHYWIGNHFDEKNNTQNWPQDITGNGIPDIVITSWNGGAHCCNTLMVFELAPTGLKQVLSIDGGSNGFSIRDLDGDTIPEIEFWDWPIDYLFNSFAHSAQGKVILKVVDNNYDIAEKLMSKSPPSHKELLRLKKDIEKDFQNEPGDAPYSFLKLMMDLNYSGHKDLAVKLADEVWPKGRAGAEKFKIKFNKALSESKYWKEFYKIKPN